MQLVGKTQFRYVTIGLAYIYHWACKGQTPLKHRHLPRADPHLLLCAGALAARVKVRKVDYIKA